MNLTKACCKLAIKNAEEERLQKEICDNEVYNKSMSQLGIEVL